MNIPFAIPWKAGSFVLALGAHLALLVGTVWTLVRPDQRLWPPPGRDSWLFRLAWALFSAGLVGFVALGILDWNSLALAAGFRFWVGGPLVIGGLGLASWGIASLGLDQALGLEGEFVARGPYRFTRNPQYVGDIAATAGWMILSESLLVVLTGAPAVVWYFLLPRTEEPWLEEQFGDEYRDYVRRVPRFLGRPETSIRGE